MHNGLEHVAKILALPVNAWYDESFVTLSLARMEFIKTGGRRLKFQVYVLLD